MRHGKKINSLGRTAAHRKATMMNLANALIEHKSITTTLAKAKELRKYIEPLVTKSKLDTTHSRRTIFSYLHNKTAVNELFREISTKVADRPGGYTRIIKMGTRSSDSAEMGYIEFVDYNDNLLTDAKQKTGKKRTRRGGKKQIAATDSTATENADNNSNTASSSTVKEATEQTNKDTEPKTPKPAEAKTETKANATKEDAAVKQKPEDSEKSDKNETQNSETKDNQIKSDASDSNLKQDTENNQQTKDSKKNTDK